MKVASAKSDVMNQEFNFINYDIYYNELYCFNIGKDIGDTLRFLFDLVLRCPHKNDYETLKSNIFVK